MFPYKWVQKFWSILFWLIRKCSSNKCQTIKNTPILLVHFLNVSISHFVYIPFGHCICFISGELPSPFIYKDNIELPVLDSNVARILNHGNARQAVSHPFECSIAEYNVLLPETSSATVRNSRSTADTTKICNKERYYIHGLFAIITSVR